MEALYREYRKNEKVAFYFIYVNEAHPARTPVQDARDLDPKHVGRAERIEDRILAASKCMVGLELSLPVLIDSMSGVSEKAYRGRPAATCVIDIEGKVRLHTTGPWGTQPEKARAILKKLLPEQPAPPAEQPKEKRIRKL